MNQLANQNQGETFAHVTYIVGDTKLGAQRTSVAFEIHQVFLLVRRRNDNKNLLAIPWANIRDIEPIMAEKSYLGKIFADIFRVIPYLNMFQIASWAEYGLTLNYWDEEVQREQSPSFAIGGDPRRFETLRYAILLLRDQFIAPLGTNSRPNRR